MDRRPAVAIWSALAFMACAAPVAWLWGLRPDWTRSDILALLQTVFSVVALLAALTIALFEFRRAMGADRRRRAAVVHAAQQIGSRSLGAVKDIANEKYLNELINNSTPRDTIFHHLVKHAVDELSASSDALETLASQALPDTDLFMAIVQLQRLLKVGLQADTPLGFKVSNAYAQKSRVFIYANSLIESVNEALLAVR